MVIQRVIGANNSEVAFDVVDDSCVGSDGKMLCDVSLNGSPAEVVPYEHCNLHGLWVGSAVTTTAADTYLVQPSANVGWSDVARSAACGGQSAVLTGTAEHPDWAIFGYSADNIAAKAGGHVPIVSQTSSTKGVISNVMRMADKVGVGGTAGHARP